MKFEESLSIKTYYLVEDQGNDMDTFVTYHATPEAAKADALAQWEKLTAQEQKKRTISAWSVTQELIQDDLVEEDAPWWEATADRQDLLVGYGK